MAKPREWTVLRDDETSELDREAVVQTLVDIEATGHLLGGAFQLAPIRHQVGDQFETVGWVFRWYSTAPAVRLVEQPDEAADADAA